MKLSKDMKQILIVGKDFDQNVKEFLELNGGRVISRASDRVLVSGDYGDLWIYANSNY